ncbi:MAG: carboxymuconolactone decarboxylase family protein [Bdellovibrionales bacterium]|nr:carboxymuconolactone decarboxylase family protein [Bdellovibrionales bacterium]
MQRISPQNNPQGKAAELLNNVKRSLGSTPNMFTTMANSPALLEGYLGLNSSLAGGALPTKVREQIALTVAGANGCDYCASAHTFLGEKAGVNETDANLKGRSNDVKTQAALNFAKSLVEQRGRVADSDLQATRDAGYSDEEILEIIGAVALNTLTNYFNEAVKTEIDFPKICAQGCRLAA